MSQVIEEPKYPLDEYCGIKGVGKRSRFVIEKLFNGETHTLSEWDELVEDAKLDIKF